MKSVFQHMTVPVDGSTTSQRGVAFALELARDDGRVSFCSVVDPNLTYTPAAYGAAVDPGPLLAVLDDAAAEFCRRAQDEAAKLAIAWDTRVLHGATIDEIQSFAAHNGSDAVVIGTHGRTGLSRAVLGSVAEGVLRRSEVPVVSVHEDDVIRTGPLAVAIDGSAASQAAFDVAIRIAGARGMSMMLIHVSGATPHSASVNATLDRAAARAASHGIEARLVVHGGVPADDLLRVSDAHDCCMIVMGTHGRSQLAQLIVGSVAAAVVERARVPVVTVRG